jgi:hypothetical protein
MSTSVNNVANCERAVSTSVNRWEAAAKGEWGEEEKLPADDLLSVSAHGRFDKAANVEAVNLIHVADLKTVPSRSGG